MFVIGIDISHYLVLYSPMTLKLTKKFKFFFEKMSCNIPICPPSILHFEKFPGETYQIWKFIHTYTINRIYTLDIAYLFLTFSLSLSLLALLSMKYRIKIEERRKRKNKPTATVNLWKNIRMFLFRCWWIIHGSEFSCTRIVCLFGHKM